MSEPTSQRPDDPVLTVRLPVSAWIVIGDHLRRGVYEDVAAIIAAIYDQATGQLLPREDSRTATDAATAAIHAHRQELAAAQEAEAQGDALLAMPTPTVVN